MATLELRRITKSFNGFDVLKGIDIDVADGSFVVLVGPSGCGKSTVLRLVAGLDEATSGNILLDGRRVNDVDAAKRDIAMVFQSYALYPHMTNADNIAFHMRIKGVSRDQRDSKVKKVAATLGIEHLLERYPRELSGGQRQRVAMGRALVRDPKIALYDEPLSNLDAQLRLELRTEIKALRHRIASTTVYVTHDQVEALTLADRIVVMRDGLVEQSGAPLDVFDRPANTFVARFIGSPPMNLLDGVVAESGGRIGVSIDGFFIPHPEVSAAWAGRPVIVGIRPPSFSLGGDADGLPGVVQVVEMTGLETMLHVAVGQKPVHAVLQGRFLLAAGAVVHLHLNSRDIHLFDSATQARL